MLRIDMQSREGYSSRVEGLLRRGQHHRGILTDGIEHRRPGKFRRNFTQNLNALGFKSIKVRKTGTAHDVTTLSTPRNSGCAVLSLMQIVGCTAGPERRTNFQGSCKS